jgi:LysR family glycine cleavage system transcriptional activator
MARRLPSLNALRAFEAAARHESFTDGAAELFVTHAAVSRHIRELEEWLGTELFTRTGRGVDLTDAGRRFGIRLTPLFDNMADATREGYLFQWQTQAPACQPEWPSFRHDQQGS